MKSESGQFQLLRIGPAPTAQQLQQNNISGTANQTIRLQTVPAVSRFTGPPLALRKTIVTQQVKQKSNVIVRKTNYYNINLKEISISLSNLLINNFSLKFCLMIQLIFCFFVIFRLFH